MKLIILVVLIGAIGFIAITCGLQCLDKKSSEAPDGATYSIKTPSRLYYAEKVTSDNGIYKLTGYWHLKDGKWVHVDGILDLNAEFFEWVKVNIRTVDND